MALFAPNHIGHIGGPMAEEPRSEETYTGSNGASGGENYGETYNEAFPTLGGASERLKMTATRPAATRAVLANTKTEVRKIPVEEFRFTNDNTFNMEIKRIQEESNAKIDVSVAKDRSLTLVLTGRPEQLSKARSLINSKLTKEASISMDVAKEFHRFILGKAGGKLSEIEKETGTRVNIPRANDTSNGAISITGSKEGLHRAKCRIQAIVDEMAKSDRRVLQIPQQFHTLLSNNPVLGNLTNSYGGSVKIHMPPKVGNVDKPDEIAIAGDREPVGKVADELLRLYERMKKNCKTLNLTIAKPKHKYIIGPKGATIQEIFKETGVAITVPPPEADSDQVTLFGESDKIGLAVSQVLQKADSSNRVEVPAPGWLQRHMKPVIDQVKSKYGQGKVHIDFIVAQDHIAVEGPTQEVEQVQKILEDSTQELLKRLKYAEVKVNPKYYRHLIGRGGKSITELRNETGVNIIFPDEKTEKTSDLIRIEGDTKQVEVARRKLMEEVARIENEKSKEVVIEKRFHRFLVAKRAKFMDAYPNVYISFPKQEEKSNLVEIRGPKNDVEKASALLKKMYDDVKAENYEAPVNVMKQFHKRIIGKGGANVAKIREQTHVDIDLPPADSDSQRITVRGRKENVEKAVHMIEEMQKAFENTVELTIEIPSKFHDAIKGPRGAGVQAIQQQYDNCIIKFPTKETDKIIIFGPKEEVEQAKKMLLERANEVKETSYSEELHIKPEYHRYLIGKRGTKVRQIYEETKARVVFPDSQSHGEEAEIVVIIGRENDVRKARRMIDSQVKHLEETKEDSIQIEPQYHKHFVSRKGMVVNMIASECGNVSISFPRQGSDSSVVTIKGPKDCVAEASKRMLEELDKLKREVTIQVEIAAKHRRDLLGRDGQKINAIMKQLGVNITFPPSSSKMAGNLVGKSRGAKSQVVSDPEISGPGSRETSSPDDSSLTTTTEGDNHNGADSLSQHSPSDNSSSSGQSNEAMMTVTISGLDDECVQARDQLLALIPVSEDLQIPHEFHRSLIGKKGSEIKEIMDKYDVNVKFPDPKEQSDIVTVKGAQNNVDSASVALQERVKTLEAEKEDRVLRSFRLSVKVNPLLQSKFTSRNWNEANRIMKKFEVNLSFPSKTGRNQGQADDELVISGYEADCNAAKAEIERVAGPIESQFLLEIPVDRRIIPRMMGSRGKNLHELMEQFKCQIIVPQGNNGDTVTVQLVGAEDDIYLCRNHLEVLQEDALLDLPPLKAKVNLEAAEEEENTRRGASNRPHGNFELPNSDKPSKGKKKQQGYVLKDAPWSAKDGKNAPDLGSSHDFPAFLPGTNQAVIHANGQEQLPPIGHNTNGVIGSPTHAAPSLGWGPAPARP